MKVSIIKRLEALEQRARQAAEPPTLIRIHFDEIKEKWSVTEDYIPENWKRPSDSKSKTFYFDRLQDYFFPAEFNGHVIMDTSASPDPAIYGNLFSFDINELRDGKAGEIAIQSISEPEENSINVDVSALIIR